MSQNGKRKASSEDIQEPSTKRQRLGEPEHAETGTNATVSANNVEQATTTNATVPANIIGQPTTTTYDTVAGQAATGAQVNTSQSPLGKTVNNAAGVGATVDNDEGALAAPQSGLAGPKRKRGASSPAPEEPSSKQSARGQKRAGLHDAGLNDKERGTFKEREGHLYCMHPVDKKWVPAVFHSAIRAELIAAASVRGSYSVERARGALENDVTSYLESQRDWSGERPHWPRIRHNVLNRHERNGWRDDYYRQRASVWIHTDGRMVIDHDRNPMYVHPDLPDTLSSAVEGWYLEAVMRLDSRILRETIRARLPDARRPPKSRKAETESMYALTAISNKRLRFRQDEGLVAWDSRAVSTEMNDYFRSFIPQASLNRNSNEGGRTLSKPEREHGKSLSKGKRDQTKKSGTTSSCTTTPDQATALNPVTMESEGITPAQASHAAFDGSILPRVHTQTSPSPLAQANGQLSHPYHQEGQAIDPSLFPFLPDEGFNPYQTQHFEPIPSAFNQGNAAPHTAPMGPPPPAYFDRTSLTGLSSSAPYYNVQDQSMGQPRRILEPQHLERSMNRVGTNVSNRTPEQTNVRTGRPGGSRRDRARWRNDDPPVFPGAAIRPNGGISAGNRSNDVGHSPGSNGAISHAQSTRSPADRPNRVRQRPFAHLANNAGTESLGRSSIVAGVMPQIMDSSGERRTGDSIQHPINSVHEAPADDVNDPQVEDEQESHLDESPFVLDDGWPTALDLELLGFVEAGSTKIDPNSSGNGLEPAPNDTAGLGSTRQVYFDNSAPLQDGQQNTVWRLDDNGTWVLEETPGETTQDQAVNASNNTASRQPPADTNGKSLASGSTSPQLSQTGETGISLGETSVPATSAANHHAQPTPSSTALDQPSLAQNNTFQQAVPADETSSLQTNAPSATPTENTGPAEEIRPHQAIPTNNFQYATIQTLLEPTRRHFISAFQDESWRSYVPRDFVPPTDRSLSLLGAFEQLSVDFWEVWTSRFGTDTNVPPLALPSNIDEFSAAVLLGLPYP